MHIAEQFNQSKYIQAYMKKNYRRISLLLRAEEDADIIAWLNKQPNISAYIKRLIIEDMKK